MIKIISKTMFKGDKPKINAGTYKISISGIRHLSIKKKIKNNIMSHAKSEFNTTYYCKNNSDAMMFRKIMNHDFRKGKL